MGGERRRTRPSARRLILLTTPNEPLPITPRVEYASNATGRVGMIHAFKGPVWACYCFERVVTAARHGGNVSMTVLIPVASAISQVAMPETLRNTQHGETVTSTQRFDLRNTSAGDIYICVAPQALCAERRQNP